jgi:hypothetical protein
VLQQQVLTPERATSDLIHLEERVDLLTRRADESESLLRRNLEEIRAEVRRERSTTGNAVTLLLVAVICLIAYLMTSLAAGRGEGIGEPDGTGPDRQEE